MDTSQLGKSQQATVTVLAATLATVPPVKASMVALAGLELGSSTAPRRALLDLFNSAAAVVTLTGGVIWGWSRAHDKPMVIGFVLDGAVATVHSGYGVSQLLDDVVACYTHLGITGTLSGNSLVMYVTPIEGRGR
jgi:hypothetical protein